MSVFEKLNQTYDFLRFAWQRPDQVQTAALCYRMDAKTHDLEILLVSSRDTGRWILPKGWIMKGKTGVETALQEAWEEAGVFEAKANSVPIGYYGYKKRMKNGMSCNVRTTVYAAQVIKMKKAYPECDERKLRWESPKSAAGFVQEPQLKEIILGFRAPA